MKKKTSLILIIIIALSAIIISLVIIKDRFFTPYYDEGKLATVDSVLTHTPVLEYGIPVDSFIIESGVIKNGQLPANLFRSLGASNNVMTQLVLLPTDTFDLRRIKAGNTYKAFYTADTSNKLSYLVYEMSATDYAVFDLRDSLCVRLDSKPVTTVRKAASAEISSSLWNAIAGNGMNTLVALELSDVFAWTIDFFGLQKGDKFEIIYDEMYVDSASVGIGKIYAARFVHSNKPYYAFYFNNDSIQGYWDENGDNLKKAFLKAPLKFSRISSGFTYARKHPILKTTRAHTGVDYAAPAGTPVMSIGQGTVIEKGYKGQGGNTIKIRHNSTYTTAYLHLSKFGKDLAIGSRVEQGQVIGYVGSTGLSTGPHLDFRVWKNGTPVNPLTIESPPADPITPEMRPAFDSIQHILIKELENLQQ